ncbi:PREDICTED: leukocyte elastase inhibitor [Dufourea novaeangliae]|uniref:leukocyte elastase inhibitor n=1 Tax=Dufourea novaeangliae TaxID=178035 RepID=UPI0007678727|nr:PREDICTED: leukocyte elastase inhibitor [Dufourea novaeangliae]
MTVTLMFLGLLVCISGQLIYPDQYEKLQTSTVPPFFYTIAQQQPRPSANRNVGQKITYSAPTGSQFSPTIATMLGISTPLATQTLRPMGQKITETPLLDWNDHVNGIIVKGIMKFALDIEREIYRTRGTSMIEQRDNIVFSPISLSVVLAIVLAGSAGRTFDEVSRVLGLEAGVDISRTSEVVHQMFGIMLAQLQNEIEGSGGPRVNFATAAFVQDGYPILSQFKSISQDVYQNEVINVDFTRNGRMTQEMINAWVKQKTMGKIDSILNGPPVPETTLILLSALYFNGEWKQHFLEGATKRKPFFVEPNESIDVDMMYNGGQFPFYEDKQLGVKILGLPYKGEQMSMYVMLPTAKGAIALRGFLNQLTVDNIEGLIGNMKNETCIVSLPRMKLSSSLSLKSTLASLGLHSLFNPETADLSLVSQGNNGRATSPGTPTNRTTPSNRYQNTDKVFFENRFGDTGDKTTGHVVRRNYFTYEDKPHGYTVEQWSTGFSIRKSPRGRRDSEAKRGHEQRPSSHERTNLYNVEGTQDGTAKVVNLEANKYRFQERRTRRQSRPIDQNFLEFLRRRNFPPYGLDELRNSATLVNPRIYASDVLHKVEIDITEKGTEAAAVTGVILERDGNQKRFLANRPFLFFIRHDPTRLVLFWGTVNVPTPNSPTVVT